MEVRVWLNYFISEVFPGLNLNEHMLPQADGMPVEEAQ